MGGLNGLELCREIRMRPPLKHTAIIAVTQLSDAEYWRSRLAEAGAIGLVSKPMNANSIVEIERLLSRCDPA